MKKSLEQRVRRRAKDACEYCRMPQVFYRSPIQVDHIIARKHGGPTVAANLAVACLHCNLHKGPNLSGIDRLAKRRGAVGGKGRAAGTHQPLGEKAARGATSPGSRMIRCLLSSGSVASGTV
ncbi:MAG: HNH endonuclease [Planctomycetia bacterium]|nr:HNH endonuclease [Planctomycetia bacterium]